ncbi:MAG: hypothetical protein LAO51_01360 [Acidobacteriia bacterium]|nr:hypothetical protein [Terriglobia bacterium]
MLGLGIFLVVVAAVVSLAGTVMFAIAAFRVSLMWGFLVLLVPFAGLVFLVKFWPLAKRGFLVGLAGSGIAVAGYLVLSIGIASAAKAQLAKLADPSPPGTERPRLVARPAVVEPAASPSSRDRNLKGRFAGAGGGRGLPEASSELADPSEIRPRDLPRHVGEDLRFVAKAGGSVWGKLVAVKPNALTIERLVHGGSVRYDLAMTDLRQVRSVD